MQIDGFRRKGCVFNAKLMGSSIDLPTVKLPIFLCSSFLAAGPSFVVAEDFFSAAFLSDSFGLGEDFFSWVVEGSTGIGVSLWPVDSAALL